MQHQLLDIEKTLTLEDATKPWHLDWEKGALTPKEVLLWELFILTYTKRQPNGALHLRVKKDVVYPIPVTIQDRIYYIQTDFAADINETITPAPEKFESNNDIPAKNTVLIDPVNLTSQTRTILRAALKGKKKILGGEVLTKQDGTTYILAKEYNLYRFKPASVAVCSFRGKGNGRVEKVVGVLKKTNNKGLDFIPYAKKLRSPDAPPKKKKWVAKITPREGATSMGRERKALKRTGFRVKRVVELENENGLLMQKVSGINLHQYLYSQGKKRQMTCREAVTLCEGIAIAYKKRMSANNMVHLDLKPANIMVGHTDADIIDMGFARKVGKRKYDIGTPGYVAREVYDQKNPCSAQADIFSFGLVFGEIFGKLNFRECAKAYEADIPLIMAGKESLSYYYWAAAQGSLKHYFIELFADFNDIDFSIKKKIQDFILAMIHPDPAKRPTPEEVCEFFSGLRKELEKEAVLEVSISNPAPSPTPSQQGERESRTSQVKASPSQMAVSNSGQSSIATDRNSPPGKEPSDSPSDMLPTNPPQSERDFAISLLKEILSCDGKVTKRFGYFGGKNVTVSAGILGDQQLKKTYLLPTGAAQMAAEVMKFLDNSHEPKIQFADLITLCIKHAVHGYSRNPKLTMFSGQLPEVTKFYEKNSMLTRIVREKLGQTIELNRSLFSC